MDFLTTLWSLTTEMAPYLLFGFFVAGLLKAFVPQSVYRRHLSRPGFRSVLNATLLGVPLPLCSCGVIPTTVALRRAGASRGACTSFLIATPQTGVDSILATYSLLGLPFAIVRPVAALVTGLLGGCATDLLCKDAPATPADAQGCCSPDDSQQKTFQTPPSKLQTPNSTLQTPNSTLHTSNSKLQTPTPTLQTRLRECLAYGFGELMEDVGRWLVVGLVVAALITVFVPNDFFVAMHDYPLVNMLLVLVVAIPMYLCATGSIPIALSLLAKGLTPGAALVMLMAGPAVNAASLLVVGKALGRRQMMAYLGSIVGGAVGFGLLIDYVLPSAWFTVGAAAHHACCHDKVVPLHTAILTVLFVVLLVRALVARQLGHCHEHCACHDAAPAACKADQTVVFTVTGMRCSHCAANARQAVEAVAGVEGVDVDLPSGRVAVTGDFDSEAVVEAIGRAGYSASISSSEV